MDKGTRQPSIEPRPLTNPSTHELLIELLERDFHFTRGQYRLLDAPCGTGSLSMRMRSLGFEVYCCDIDPGHFKGDDFKMVQADLNRALPYTDNSFDLIVSVAGLQRLYFPEMAVNEFYRILKPGGSLIISVPNNATLKKRIRYFLYGSLGQRFNAPKYSQMSSLPEANLRFPLTYPRVEQMVTDAGFTFASLETNIRGIYPYALFPVTFGIWIIVRIRSAYNPEKYGCYLRSTTPSMLWAEAFVIIARKE